MKVIIDRSNRTTHYSTATFLAHASIPVWIDAQHAIAHNKVMIIDGDTVLTVSFNFTKTAEQQNAENLMRIRDWALAEKYTANWQKHLQHSEPYGAAQPPPHQTCSGQPRPRSRLQPIETWSVATNAVISVNAGLLKL